MSQGMGVALHAQFFGVDCGLTKCCRSSDFFDGSASVPSSQKFEVFHSIPLQMLSIPSGQSTICLYHNLFLEGRGLGLLLYGDNLVMYGAICVCKRKYSEKHVWDFLWVWWKELRPSAQWEAPSHSSPPESSRRDSHTRWSLENLVPTMVQSLRQVISSEPGPSISIKQIPCCLTRSRDCLPTLHIELSVSAQL